MNRAAGGALRRARSPWAALACAVLALGGCTSIVRAPVDPEDPVAVVLVFDDRHRGIALPRQGGGFVEYGYGDWDWYAGGQDRWYDVFDTVLWPTQGTLGRRISAAADPAELRRELHWIDLHELLVARADMVRLRALLGRQFDDRQDRQVWSAVYRMSFVPHDDGYWFLHNCNDAAAGWLEELGCSVSWVPIRLGLAVARR